MYNSCTEFEVRSKDGSPKMKTRHSSFNHIEKLSWSIL